MNYLVQGLWVGLVFRLVLPDIPSTVPIPHPRRYQWYWWCIRVYSSGACRRGRKRNVCNRYNHFVQVGQTGWVLPVGVYGDVVAFFEVDDILSHFDDYSRDFVPQADFC